MDCGEPSVQRPYLFSAACLSSTFNSSCTISCLDGAETSQVDVITCLANGSWSSPSTCIHSTEYSWDTLLLTVFTVSSILILMMWIYNRFFVVDSMASILFLLHLTVFDLLSDIIFFFTCWYSSNEDLSALSTFSLIFIVIPVVVNYAAGIRMFQYLQEQPSFLEWSTQQDIHGIVFIFVSGFNQELANLMQSKLFGLRIFSAPISEQSYYYIRRGGIFTNLLEDLPQLVIQGVALSEADRNVSIISIIFSRFVKKV